MLSGGGSTGLPRFGLYFPYIHVRDESWIKVAALYWPKMARVVPADYPTHDSETLRALAAQLDWTVDLSPEGARDRVAPLLLDLIHNLTDAQLEAWSPERQSALDRALGLTARSDVQSALEGRNIEEVPEPEPPSWGAGPKASGGWHGTLGLLAGVLTSELDPGLCRTLIKKRLAVPGATPTGQYQTTTRLLPAHRDPWTDEFDFEAFLLAGGWLVMHRDLAWIYKCLLSEELASRNRLTLTTDQVEGHAAVSGLDATQLALGGVEGRAVEGDLATAFGLAALRTVVPRDLDRVPIQKIITVRERYGEHFDAWRDHIDRVGTELAEQLGSVEAPEVLHAYLDEAARRYAEAPVEQLRRDLSNVGLDAADIALNTRYETPAAIAATGLAAGNPVAVVAGVAVGVAELRRRTRSQARAKLASPNAYLLDVKATLTPRSWLERILSSMRAAAGLRG